MISPYLSKVKAISANLLRFYSLNDNVTHLFLRLKIEIRIRAIAFLSKDPKLCHGLLTVIEQCFLKGRFNGESIRLMNEVVHYSDIQNISVPTIKNISLFRHPKHQWRPAISVFWKSFRCTGMKIYLHYFKEIQFRW